MNNWILVRTGGVYEIFEGGFFEALAECRRRNLTDDQGTTEVLSGPIYASDALAEIDRLSAIA